MVSPNPDNKPEPMKYAIFGSDDSSEAEKQENYTATVGWEYLRPHFQNGVLIYVDPGLTLGEVGDAIARDDRAQVASWLHTGDLVKVGELHANQWEGTTQQFYVRIVSPFVLMQMGCEGGGS